MSETTEHYGRVESFPPYVGGDDDDIDEWQAECKCGWKAERRWEHVGGAHIDLIKHLNEAISHERDQVTREIAARDHWHKRYDEANKRADTRADECLRFMEAAAVEYKGKCDAEKEVENLREENARLDKIVDEKIDSVGDLVIENEKLRKVLAVGEGA